VCKTVFELFLEVTKSWCFRVPWGSCSTVQQPRVDGVMWEQKAVADEENNAALVPV